MSRYGEKLLAPLLISLILIGAHWAYGILRSYEAILLAIGSAVATELILSRLLLGKARHIGSAYVSGISLGILIHSPVLWPYALGGVLSIMSKYVLSGPARGTSGTRPTSGSACSSSWRPSRSRRSACSGATTSSRCS